MQRLSWKEEREFADKKSREIAAQFVNGKAVERPIREHDESSGLFDYLDLGNEAQISFGYDFRKDRVIVRGRFPSTSDHSTVSPREALRHSEENTYGEITIDLNKPVAVIAKDIQRRFLPGYEKVLARCKEVRDSRDAATRKQAANVQEIAKLAGGRVSPNGDKSTVYSEHADIRVGCSSADFTIRSLDIDKARKLAAFLKSLDQKDEVSK